MSSGIAIEANAEDPLSDHSSHLDSELSIPTIDIKRFRLHLLRKVTNGEHVGNGRGHNTKVATQTNGGTNGKKSAAPAPKKISYGGVIRVSAESL